MSYCEPLLPWKPEIILYFIFLKILFIYLTERGERENALKQAEREGDAGSILGREPDVGLDHRPRDHDLS